MLALEEAFAHRDFGDFFRAYYGEKDAAVVETDDGKEIPSNTAWRRMEQTTRWMPAVSLWR
ncbi:hypothetical protein AJ87_13230 [Rhizobium yanglingense]|nr:hypothetical protein AJ87_13230 [Rhizobium yanglingense]